MPMWEQPGTTRTSRQAVSLLVTQEQGGAARGAVPSNRWVQCAGLMTWLASITGTAPGLLLHASDHAKSSLVPHAPHALLQSSPAIKGPSLMGKAGATQAADVPVSASASTAPSSATPSQNPEPSWSPLADLRLMCDFHV
jgi:hypothetical protein